jgi:signal peptidase I
VLVIAAVAALRLWVVESAIVDGFSMASTLEPGEWVLVLKPLKPHRFSVVTLADPEGGGTLIKRVVGMPGDTIAIEPVDSREQPREVGYTSTGCREYRPRASSLRLSFPDEVPKAATTCSGTTGTSARTASYGR